MPDNQKNSGNHPGSLFEDSKDLWVEYRHYVIWVSFDLYVVQCCAVSDFYEY